MIKPVSFGSMMVFTINDKPSQLSVPQFMNLAFNHNQTLKNYQLTDTFEYTEDQIDGTVHNAAKNFAELLDVKYKPEFHKGSKKVILTEADFFVNPRDTQKRYFLTAASDEDEAKIHSILSESGDFYAARFGNKAYKSSY